MNIRPATLPMSSSRNALPVGSGGVVVLLAMPEVSGSVGVGVGVPPVLGRVGVGDGVGVADGEGVGVS